MGSSAKGKKIYVNSYSSVIGAQTKKGTKGDDLFNLKGFSIEKNAGTYYMNGGKGKDSIVIPTDSHMLHSFKSVGKKAQFEIEYMNFDATGIEYLVFDDITLKLTSKGLVSSNWRPKGLEVVTEFEDSTLSGQTGTWEKTVNQYGVDVISLSSSDGSKFLTDGNNFVLDENKDQYWQNNSSEPTIGKVKSILLGPSFYPYSDLKSDAGSWVVKKDSTKGYISWKDGTIAAWLDITDY